MLRLLDVMVDMTKPKPGQQPQQSGAAKVFEPSNGILLRTQFLGQPLTVYGTEDRPLFCAHDIASRVGFVSTPNMVRYVQEGNKQKLPNPTRIFGSNRMWFLTVDGINDLFKRWSCFGGIDTKPFADGINAILKEIRSK